MENNQTYAFLFPRWPEPFEIQYFTAGTVGLLSRGESLNAKFFLPNNLTECNCCSVCWPCSLPRRPSPGPLRLTSPICWEQVAQPRAEEAFSKHTRGVYFYGRLLCRLITARLPSNPAGVTLCAGHSSFSHLQHSGPGSLTAAWQGFWGQKPSQPRGAQQTLLLCPSALP